MIFNNFLITILITTIFWGCTSSGQTTFDICTAECKTDVMYIDECIEDERKFWNPKVSDINLKHACMDLIRNKRLECYSDCEKEFVKYNHAVEYYDKEVKNFPITNY